MAALRDIKRKITAVQKTKQITRAMNMVAASKLKSAQMRMENFRPYAIRFMDVLKSLALRVDPKTHPLLAVREARKIRLICMTSDRGLCGAFNSNILKLTERFIRDKKADGLDVSLIPVGRKGRDYFRRKITAVNAHADVFGRFDMSLAVRIGEDVIPSFISEEYDELYLIYSEFNNVAIQRPVAVRLLPIPSVGLEEEVEPDKRLEYIYEPSEEALLDQLLPMYIRVLIYRALVETAAGENAARMMAMDNATNNCDEMIDNLTLRFNKTRQAAITKELMDIVGGAEALKG
ncbi:MAG: ATP synthase F1 subunit gamma [Syntrophales bacterium]|nr:ATP synthase F1 subunit gamma [Syntrophales bacterium]MDD5233740.1 ATP synthase F1 subunit gamma [Syntrophales bacterium]MDD5531498.1 ATP synthase F1 subunit gamma [Syntrophales bacterium]